jgi:4-amino-4-deoxy-L-arabinose transferase-like glycosyltransferase
MVAALVLLLLLVLSLPPLISETRGPELNSEPDEAAHYVTALMIRTYVVDAIGTGPREFAEKYYLHYPKVAFGIWPPLFHLTLACWMLLTGPSVWAALLFMSLTATLVAFVLFAATRRTLGTPLAAATAVWFIAMPAMQASTSSVMMDMLCTLFVVCAAVSFGRYLDTERTPYALGFAVLSAAAMLTKYNALSMALVPPLAVIAARRWAVLKRPNFWLMPAVVAALCAPWYVLQWNMVRYAAEPVPPRAAAFIVGRDNFLYFVQELGVLALPLAAIGFVAVVIRKRQDHGMWCGLFALLASLWIFHSLIYPIPGARYLLGAFGALAAFTAAGLHVIIVRLLAVRPVAAPHAVRFTAAAIVLLALLAWSPAPRFARGFAEAADMLLDGRSRPDVTTLVSSDAIGEGAFVAHVATQEVQPQSIVLRGNKLLATGDWMFSSYAPRYRDSAAVLDALDRARVAYVVLDDQSDRAHHRLLEQAVRDSPEWTLVRRVPSTYPGTSDVRVYGRAHPLPPGRPAFELNTLESLGYNVRVQPP